MDYLEDGGIKLTTIMTSLEFTFILEYEMWNIARELLRGLPIIYKKY